MIPAQILSYILTYAGWLLLMIWVCMLLSHVSATLEQILDELKKK